MTQENPFSDLEATPAEDFRLYFYGAVLRLIGSLARSPGSFEDVFERFPFLNLYSQEISGRGVGGLTIDSAADWWHRSIESWESATDAHLPLRALRNAAHLDSAAITLFLCAGLAEEDPRFGDVFESVQSPSGQRRPTYGLLNSLRQESAEEETISRLPVLINLGFLKPVDPSPPRSEWALQIPAPLWDVISGCPVALHASWLAYTPSSELTDLSDLILPQPFREQLVAAADAMSSGKAGGLVVRGPARNGRRTAIRGAAKRLSRGVVELKGLAKDDERWSTVGLIATALNAMPVIAPELAPGETVTLPALSTYDGPVAVVLDRQGGVSGPWAEHAITLSLDVPEPDARKIHWKAGAQLEGIGELSSIAERYRMTAGNIRRAAGIAASYAAVRQTPEITLTDAQRSIRTLNHELLDGLADRISAVGDWSHLAVSPQTLEELRSLERRCRFRERLQSAVNPILGTNINPGVRALFTGPSGTGKTLSARLLASALCMDLYRINLSTVINKYIGETEKNLNLVLSRAEELAVILLLDEGDALLTQRTGVQNSNDRYANLETDFLLQRLETFEGIIIMTTNAGDHIDSAFLRRMDVVIDFRPPDVAERLAIWKMFLPSGHKVSGDVLDEISSRCSLTGGQIRNAVLHASLLALNNGGVVTSEYIESAVQREYRKKGAVCPLRSNKD